MSSNVNSLIPNQSAITGAMAVAVSPSEVTNNSSNINNNNHYRQNNSKWNRYNNKKLNGGAKTLANNNSEASSDPNELNNNANDINEESVLANQNNSSNSKKWSNYKKKPTQQNKSRPAYSEPKTQTNKKNMIGGNQQGNFSSFNAVEYRDDLVDSPLFALNSSSSSVRVGSKKTNLNHLLNFTYASNKDSVENYYEYEKYSRQFWSTKFSKSSCFNKEQFLQANCQFVVKNTGDYTVNLCDPDLMVDWDKIEEIHIESHDNISCPICLYPPQIGKIAKCGHIFNWSCILHYLSLSDKAWRKCPICYESIYKKDLKSVRINKYATEYKVGDEISFNLMFKSKSKNSTLILPHSSFEQLKADENSPSGFSLSMLNDENIYPECSKYLKLRLLSAEQIHTTILEREKIELDKQLANEKDEPEVCFVNEALELLNERENSLKLEFKGQKATKKLSDSVDKPIKQEVKLVSPKSDVFYTDAFENLSLEPKETHLSEPEIPLLENETNIDEKRPASNQSKCNIQQSMLNSSNSPTDFSYFYQSLDGQRIYINQLNARCLLSQYSAFNQCPNVITGKIIAYESFFMTEENRKRFKYLSHLPLHSEFKIVELDLKEPFISQTTLDLYEEEIEERRQFRLRKNLREKRLADKAAAANLENIPHYYTSSAMNEIRLNQTSIVDYSQEFPEASTSPPTSSGASISGTSANDSSNSEHPSNQHHQISFAQMLKHPNSEAVVATSLKKAVSNTVWPTLESSASNLTQSSTQLTNGWLNMATLQSQQAANKTKKYQDAPTPWSKTSIQNEEQPENEEVESMPAPLYAQSFFSAIDESLKLIDSKKVKGGEIQPDFDDTNQNQREKQKKKKKTKHLLFSTSLNI